MKTYLKRNYQSILMIAGILLGCTIGLLWDGATSLEFLGTIYINLMFCVVVPLVFFSIASAIGKRNGRGKVGKTVGVSIACFLVTALIAASFAFLVFCLFPLSAGEYSGSVSDVSSAVDVPSLLVNFLTQSDFVSLLSRKAVLPLIVAAVLFGFAIQKSGGENSPTEKLFCNLTDCLIRTVKLINYYAPIGFFGFFAYLAAEYGKDIVGDFGKVYLLDVGIAVLYMLLFIPLYTAFAGGLPAVKTMIRHVGKPILVAFSTRSSVATMPTNLEQAENTGIPADVREIVMPLGATMNMNGTAMSTIAKVAFLFAMFGKPFLSADGLLALVVAVLSSVATPGIPGGSNTASLILCSMFFPDHFALAFAVSSSLGHLFDPFTTTVNASMDYVASFVVARLTEGREWVKNLKNAKMEKKV